MTSPLGGPRVLETVLTARNLLSPELLKASRDVVAFNSTVMAANEKAAASGAASARAQQSAAASSAAASSKAASAATAGATTQSGAADKIAASNVKASTSASTSADQQKRAYAKAAESATVSARIHETANRSLAASNGLLGTSLTPLTAGLGAVALGLGYAAFKGMDFDKSMSQVQAATQASAGTMSQLRDAAIDAGTKTQYSAVEAAQGITELSKAGVSAKDIMSGGLSGALSLAAAGQLEVGDAAETAATALTVFGLRGNEVNHVADLLAAGAGKAQGSVSDLSQAMNQSALVAKNTGLSIDDTVGALAEFASNGLLGSDAGTSFKNMLQRLNPQSVQAATLMDDLNLHAYDAQGNFVGLANYAENLKTSLSGMSQEQRNAALTTLFGSDAIRAATILYQDGAKGVQEWTGKVNDSGFAARVAKQLMDNLGGDLNNLSSSAEAFFIQLGEGAQGPLRLVVEALTAVVNVGGDVLGFWNSLPGPVQVAVLALGGVAALKGPVGSALETIALKALYMRDSVAGASIGMGGLKAAGAGLLGFFGGPWGLAITGATVGLSLLVSWLGKSDDATSASARATQTATEAQQSYKQALSATNGVMDESVRRAAAKALQDNGLLDVAERLHISTRSMTDSLLGNKDAYEQILPVLEAYYTSLLIQSGYDHTDATDKKAAAVKAQIDAYKNLVGTQPDVITGEQQIAAATGESTAQTDEATKALEEWRKQLQDVGSSFVEPLSTYKDLLSQKQQAEHDSAQATADATKSSKDSWKDYVKEASVSLDEYATKLEEQLTAQENWRTNLVTVTKRGGLEVGQALAAMGVEGAGITAQMANATGADFKRLKNDMIRDARLGGAGATAELDNAMKIQAGVTASGGKATAQALAKQLGLGVDQVAAIAKQYGIKLAAGINPLLTALGHPTVAGYHVAGRNGGPGGTQTKNADGNLYEQHQAEIAPGGAMRVWAEPETEGEAYIPLARSKRARSLSIWRQTGKHLDAPEAQHFASGGFATATDVPHPSSTAPYRMPISTAGDAAMGKEYAETTNWVREHGPIGAALSWAKSQVGKPYIWGGVGPEGYDCSGFMSAITNVLLRRNPYSRVGATANFPWPGFTAGNGAFTIGSTSDAGGGIGHMAGTLMGVNVESRGGQGVVVGGSARGASNSLFHTRAHLAMYGGGVITEPVVGIGARTGNSYSFGERGPETVTPSAAAAMPGYGMGGGGGGGTRTSVSVPAPQVKVYLDGKEWRGIARVEATVVVDGVLTEIHDTVHYAGG